MQFIQRAKKYLLVPGKTFTGMYKCFFETTNIITILTVLGKFFAWMTENTLWNKLTHLVNLMN